MVQSLLMVAVMGITTTSMAQTDGVCCDPTHPNYEGPACSGSGDFFGDPDCTAIPIDGGLSLLALAGGGLAVARLRKRREEEEDALNA